MNRRAMIKMVLATAIPLPATIQPTKEQILTFENGSTLTLGQINDIAKDVFYSHVESLFERDDSFYSAIRR